MSGIPLAGTCHLWPFDAQGQFDLPLELRSTSWPRPPQSPSGPVTAMSWPRGPSLPEKKHPSITGRHKFDPSILPDLLLGLWRLVGFPFKMNGLFTHCSRVLVTPNQYISIHLRIVMFKGVWVYLSSALHLPPKGSTQRRVWFEDAPVVEMAMDLQ